MTDLSQTRQKYEKLMIKYDRLLMNYPFKNLEAPEDPQPIERPQEQKMETLNSNFISPEKMAESTSKQEISAFVEQSSLSVNLNVEAEDEQNQ